MKKESADSLVLLIKTLKDEELKAFKKYIRTLKNIDHKKFIALIRFFQKEGKNVDKFCEEFDITKNYFAVLKNRLFGVACDFIVEHEFAQKDKMVFYHTYILMNFLHSRRQYGLVDKVFKKGKKELNLNANPIRSLLINDLYGSSLIGGTMAMERKEELNQIDEEISQKAYMAHVYYIVNIVKRRMYFMPIREAVCYNDYNGIEDWEIQYRVEKQKGFFPLAYQILLIIKSYYDEIGDWEFYSRYVLEQVEIIDLQPKLTNKQSLSYQKLLLEAAKVSYDGNNLDKALLFLGKIVPLPELSQPEQNHLSFIISQSQLLKAKILWRLNKRDEANKELKEGVKLEKNYGTGILPGNIARYKIELSLFYFHTKAFKESLKELNKVINDKSLNELFYEEKGVNRLDFSKLLLLQFMIHYELSNFELLDKIASKYKTFASDNEDDSELKTAIYKLLKKLIANNLVTKYALPVLNQIASLGQSKRREQVFNYEQFSNWVSEKIDASVES